MRDRIKQSLEELKQGRPGSRFQERYERRRQECQGRFDRTSLLRVVGGVVVVLVGLVMVPGPGPGWLVVLLGLSILGGEFLTIACFLDRLEVKLRHGVGRARKAWRRSPVWVRVLIRVAVVVFALALSSLSYYVMWRSIRG